MAAGVSDAGAEPVEVPVADGGDGTLDVLLETAPGDTRITQHTVTGPLGQPLTARLGWLSLTTAVVELAEAAGLRRLPPAGLDPLHATSRGAGELIAAAIDGGARRVVVGVGGSACSDGGAGLLQALGARLCDAGGAPIAPGGAGLKALATIDLTPVATTLRGAAVEVSVDVRNPLLGVDGAARVFAPQKGASPDDVAVLEDGLRRLAAVAERDAGATGLADLTGAGAAGGCGYGLALIGAALLPGAALVCDLAGLDAALAGSALVLTGEGRLDAQTAFGKAPAEVAERARRAGVPCAAIAGQVGPDPPAALFERVLTLDALAGPEAARGQAAALLRQAARLLVAELVPPRDQ